MLSGALEAIERGEVHAEAALAPAGQPPMLPGCEKPVVATVKLKPAVPCTLASTKNAKFKVFVLDTALAGWVTAILESNGVIS